MKEVGLARSSSEFVSYTAAQGLHHLGRPPAAYCKPTHDINVYVELCQSITLVSSSNERRDGTLVQYPERGGAFTSRRG